MGIDCHYHAAFYTVFGPLSDLISLYFVEVQILVSKVLVVTHSLWA